jgi:ABC-2 type transport system permease protein
VADLAPDALDAHQQSIKLGQQLRLVAGLRWKLLRNRLRNKNNRLDLLGMIVASVLGGVLVVGVSFAFYTAAYEFTSSDRLGWMAALFWAIFIWWQIFPLFVAGFGSSFEFRTLLRFPLDRRAFYLIGLAYGLADFSSLAAVLWLAVITAGVATARISLLPATALACGIFLLLNVTLERLIGSWLERVLARRRTREIFFALFILAMISLQFINPLMQRYGNAATPLAHQILPYLAPLPGSLAGAAIAAAGDRSPAAMFTALAGLGVYTIIFSCMLWLRFAAQYRGEELSETAAPAPASSRFGVSASRAPDGLSFLSPQVAEVLRKEFRYLLRNGFSFVLLIMPPMMILIFTLQGGNIVHTGGHTRDISTLGFSRSAFFPAMMGYIVLALMAPAYNAFAYEARGIQTYFMSPLRFRDIFIGKNLMMVAIVGVEVILSIIVFVWRVGLPETPVFVATLIAVAFTVTGQLAIANWSSLTFPRKLNFGQMRGQRQSGMAVLVAFAAQIVFGVISALFFFAGRWTGNPWLPAEAFLFLFAAALGGYISSLDPLSALAEKKKESLIEALCR